MKWIINLVKDVLTVDREDGVKLNIVNSLFGIAEAIQELAQAIRVFTDLYSGDLYSRRHR